MNTALGILVLLLSFFGILVILFFIYAMRWNVIEKQVRKALNEEFKNRTDQALDLIKRENEANEIAFQKKQADLMKKRDEADTMQMKNIHSGMDQMKTRMFGELVEYINSHYKSKQTKTKLTAFLKNFKEQFKS